MERSLPGPTLSWQLVQRQSPLGQNRLRGRVPPAVERTRLQGRGHEYVCNVVSGVLLLNIMVQDFKVLRGKAPLAVERTRLQGEGHGYA